MANQLTITKQTGGYFKFKLSINGIVQPTVESIRNDLLTVGNELHFKTSNGANIIKKQNILPTELTVIDGVSTTFTTVDQVWNKLIAIGFFAWISGGASGVDRFDELLDTFQYSGKDGQVCVVDEAQLKIKPVTFYNKRFFTELDDTPNTLVANKMVVVNNDATGLILVDLPTPVPTTPTGTIFFHNNSPTATQTTFTIPIDSMVVSMHINNAFIAPQIRWIQEGTSLTLLEITAEANDEVCFTLITT